MFNSTHTLVGFAIARCGAEKRRPRYAAATAVIASNLPDIDSVSAFWGSAAYLDYHRGITHSLFAAPILALALSLIVYFFSGQFWKTYLLALLATATHPALDYLNPYGLRPWLPWSRTWYYGDAVFIFDPFLDLMLLAGISASRIVRTKRVTVWATLIVATAYIGVRMQLHSVALSILPEQAPRISGVPEFSAMPQINPFVWQGVIETNEMVARFPVYLSGRSPGREIPLVQIRRDSPSDIIARASKAPAAAALLRFARFPAANVERLSSGYRVTFVDFRFYREISGRGLGAEVILDSSLNIRRDRLSFLL